MYIIFAVLIAAILISVSLFITRDNWFRKKKRVATEEKQSEKVEEVKQPGEEKPEPAAAEKTTGNKPNRLWSFLKSAALLCLVGWVFLWVAFAIWKHFSTDEAAHNVTKVSQPMPEALTPQSRPPIELAEPVITGCESGSNGIPGTGRQFKDGKLVRNPEKPWVIGIYEINTRDPGNAAIISANQWDMAIKSHNIAMGRYLYNLYGFKPWMASWDCIARNAAYMGYGGSSSVLQAFTEVIEVPAGETRTKELRPGYEFHWGGSEGAFIIENEKGVQARFDPDNGIFEELPYLDHGVKKGYSQTVKLTPIYPKPVKIVLRFTPRS